MFDRLTLGVTTRSPFVEVVKQHMLSKEEVGMGEIQDYFMCDSCKNRKFKLVYSFSLRFHRVNFSDNLIYDNLVEETYECTKCQKTFTTEQIEEGLAKLKMRRKEI